MINYMKVGKYGLEIDQRIMFGLEDALLHAAHVAMDFGFDLHHPIEDVDISGHYSPAHTPIDEFGHLMFKGWDKYQWQLFDNFMMECIMWYFRSYNNNWGGPGLGIVPPPEKV